VHRNLTDKNSRFKKPKTIDLFKKHEDNEIEEGTEVKDAY